MSARRKFSHRLTMTVLAWIVGLLIFFPILWTVLTSFKSELDAFAIPPKFLFFHWTLENYGVVQERSNYIGAATNSILLSIGANLVGLLDRRAGGVVDGVCADRRHRPARDPRDVRGHARRHRRDGPDRLADLVSSVHQLVGLRAVGRHRRPAGRFLDHDAAHDRRAGVDAVDQDDARRRRAGADLSALSATTT